MKGLEQYLHDLRGYYSLKRKFGMGACWLPFWRRRLKSMAKRSASKNVILLDNGILVPIDASDGVTHESWLRGVLAPDLEWAINRYVKPGTVAVDVGANLGLVSILMAEKVGEKGRVFAIEPNPELRARIEKVFWLNGLRNDRIYQCGCSNKTEDASILVDQKDHSKSRVSQSLTGTQIRLLPLDSILEEADQPVSFIKIDVEGHEPEVLEGARQTLWKHRPTVIFETGTHTADQISRIGNLLKEMSYEVVGVLHEWGVESKQLSLNMTEKSHCNVLALPMKNRAADPERG